MQNDPFISVIVPTFNRAKFLPKTLESLQKQNYDNFEIIVVDDGSTDNTAEMMKSIADHKTIYTFKENGERAAARNFGAGLARGTYVNFFDSDDIALPNHLSEAAKLIKEKSEPEWFHLGFAWASPNGTVFKEVNNYEGETLNNIMIEKNPLACAGVFVRKDIFLNNRFNEDRELSASEDYELWVRLASRFPLYYNNTVTSWLVDHETRSVRTTDQEKLIKRIELMIKYLQQDEVVQTKFKKDFRKLVSYGQSYVALHLSGHRRSKATSTSFLVKAAWSNPNLLFNKRFYATIRNLLFSWENP